MKDGTLLALIFGAMVLPLWLFLSVVLIFRSVDAFLKRQNQETGMINSQAQNDEVR